MVGRDKAEMFLDGKLVSDARMEFLRSFFATAGYQRKDKTVVLKATNYHKQPIRAEIQIEGALEISSVGQHFVIRSENPNDENTLEAPLRIGPQEGVLSRCAKRFSVNLPPSSVNLLRIPASGR